MTPNVQEGKGANVSARGRITHGSSMVANPRRATTFRSLSAGGASKTTGSGRDIGNRGSNGVLMNSEQADEDDAGTGNPRRRSATASLPSPDWTTVLMKMVVALPEGVRNPSQRQSRVITGIAFAAGTMLLNFSISLLGMMGADSSTHAGTSKVIQTQTESSKLNIEWSHSSAPPSSEPHTDSRSEASKAAEAAGTVLETDVSGAGGVAVDENAGTSVVGQLARWANRLLSQVASPSPAGGQHDPGNIGIVQEFHGFVSFTAKGNGKIQERMRAELLRQQVPEDIVANLAGGIEDLVDYKVFQFDSTAGNIHARGLTYRYALRVRENDRGLKEICSFVVGIRTRNDNDVLKTKEIENHMDGLMSSQVNRIVAMYGTEEQQKMLAMGPVTEKMEKTESAP